MKTRQQHFSEQTMRKAETGELSAIQLETRARFAIRKLFDGEGLTGKCFWANNPANSVLGEMTLGNAVLGKKLHDELPANPSADGQCNWTQPAPEEFAGRSMTEKPHASLSVEEAFHNWLLHVPGGNNEEKHEVLRQIFFEQHGTKTGGGAPVPAAKIEPKEPQTAVQFRLIIPHPFSAEAANGFFPNLLLNGGTEI